MSDSSQKSDTSSFFHVFLMKNNKYKYFFFNITDVHQISDIHQFSDSRVKIIHFYEWNQYIIF